MIGVFNVILATFSHLRIGQMMLSLMFDHQPYQYYGELDLLRSIYPYLSLCLRRVLRSIIPCLWLTTVFFCHPSVWPAICIRTSSMQARAAGFKSCPIQKCICLCLKRDFMFQFYAMLPVYSASFSEGS